MPNPSPESQPVTPAKREPGVYYVRLDKGFQWMKFAWNGRAWIGFGDPYEFTRDDQFAEIGPRIPDEPANEGRERELVAALKESGDRWGEYVKFGVLPSVFWAKQWHERITALLSAPGSRRGLD